MDAETPSVRRAPIRSYEDLDVFQRSFALVRPIHELVKRFPSFESFDLVQQMRRASKSVPANIAEGYSRRQSARDFKFFLSNAQGSANEMAVHLRIAIELEYVTQEDVKDLRDGYDIVGRQLNRLIHSWRRIEPT